MMEGTQKYEFSFCLNLPWRKLFHPGASPGGMIRFLSRKNIQQNFIFVLFEGCAAGWKAIRIRWLSVSSIFTRRQNGIFPKAVKSPECSCLIGNDIGAYNSCGQGCRYCYANENTELVRARIALHDRAEYPGGREQYHSASQW